MRIPRIYHPGPLREGSAVELRREAERHLRTVLRLRPGASLSLFDGKGTVHMAILQERGALVGERLMVSTESPLSLHLLQAVSKGERMDLVIQKAVELGVREITPVLTERCVVRLKGSRAEKRHRHWREIIINACEQCGRNRLPLLHHITPVEKVLDEPSGGLKLVLDPSAASSIGALASPRDGEVHLLIGPEGGLSDWELDQATLHGFTAVRLGPRILRTETAALASLSALQVLWGDLG